MVYRALCMLLLSGLLFACGSTPKPITVAPAPLKSSEHWPASIALLAFDSDGLNQQNNAFLRRTLFAHLGHSNYRVPHIQDNDLQLRQAGVQLPYKVADFPRLAELLAVEALLVVENLSYQTVFVGVYAQISVTADLKLYNKNGEVIWQDEVAHTSRAGGVSASAWGLLYNLAMATLHLEDENLLAAADGWGREVLNKLPQPSKLKHKNAIFIESVIHDGADKTLGYGDVIQVGVKGQPGLLATANIQGVEQSFTLTEQQPGEYLGNIPVAKDWQGEQLMLWGSLISPQGGMDKMLSPVGLLTINNQPPPAPTQLGGQLDDGRLRLSWHSAADATFRISIQQQQQWLLMTTTHDSGVDIPYQANHFDRVRIRVQAQDKGGLLSEPADIELTAYPLGVMYQADVEKQRRLPTNLQGQVLLTRQFSPYVVDQQVRLTPGANLYIEPGVELQFSAAGHLLVQGGLYLFDGKPVQFNALDQAISHQTFITLDSQQHLQMRNFVMQNAGIGVQMTQGNAVLKDCQFLSSQYSALVLSGGASMRVERCVLDGSNTSGVVLSDNAKLILRETELRHHLPFHIQNSSVFSVDARQNTWQPAASATSILGNVRY